MVVLLVLAIYAAVCAAIALDRRSTFKDSARRTFWVLHLEVLNPLNWL